MLAQYAPPSYGDGYVYSAGAKTAGILCGIFPIILMIAVGFITIYRVKGSFNEVRLICGNICFQFLFSVTYSSSVFEILMGLIVAKNVIIDMRT